MGRKRETEIVVISPNLILMLGFAANVVLGRIERGLEFCFFIFFFVKGARVLLLPCPRPFIMLLHAAVHVTLHRFGKSFVPLCAYGKKMPRTVYGLTVGKLWPSFHSQAA